MDQREEGLAFRASRLAPPTEMSGLVAGQMIGIIPPAIQRARLITDTEREMEMGSMVLHKDLDRTNLRAYHRKLADIIMQAVTKDGVEYRYAKNGVILYPPDGTDRTITVHARNNERQLQELQHWYNRHVAPHVEPEVPRSAREVDAVLAPAGGLTRELATSILDASAHRPPTPAEVMGNGKVQVPPVEVTSMIETTTEVWVAVIHDDDTTSEFFETNGRAIRCKQCLGTRTEFYTGDPRSMGGHVRMCHRETESLRTPEAQAKALDTRRYNRLAGVVDMVIEELAIATGHESTKVGELQREVARLTRERDDAVTRLAMIQEAMRA